MALANKYIYQLLTLIGLLAVSFIASANSNGDIEIRRGECYRTVESGVFERVSQADCDRYKLERIRRQVENRPVFVEDRISCISRVTNRKGRSEDRSRQVVLRQRGVRIPSDQADIVSSERHNEFVEQLARLSCERPRIRYFWESYVRKNPLSGKWELHRGCVMIVSASAHVIHVAARYFNEWLINNRVTLENPEYEKKRVVEGEICEQNATPLQISYEMVSRFHDQACRVTVDNGIMVQELDLDTENCYGNISSQVSIERHARGEFYTAPIHHVHIPNETSRRETSRRETSRRETSTR